MKSALALFALLSMSISATHAAAAVPVAPPTTEQQVMQMQTDIARLQSQIDALRGEITMLRDERNPPQRPEPEPSPEIRAMQEEYKQKMTQGGTFWERTGFKINDDGTATLTGRGTAHLNSNESHANGGGGAVMRMTLTDLNDPLYKKCRKLLETSRPDPRKDILEVAGEGTYESSKADPDAPDSITYLYAFRLKKLTVCEMRKY